MKFFRLMLAFAAGIGCAALLDSKGVSLSPADQLDQNPLYWVAPMDPNYRKDGPGKSPMGMDLVPVYEDDQSSMPEGVVSISPDVVNNLGVRIAEAQRRTLHTEIRTVGYVHFDENQLIHIHPRVEGWVETLYVKSAGDPVSNDQPLYALYSPVLVNAQEELLLAIRQGNEHLVKSSEERMRALRLSAEFIDNLKTTKQIKQTVTFYAKQNGVVDKLNIREGFYVQPGTTIMSIGNLQEVWVEAEIFERQSSLVSVGLPVTMTTDYLPGRRWTGRVDYVYPTLDPTTRTARVRLRFSNEDRFLKPNMFTQVVIHANTEDNRLVVPKEAVIRTGSQARVVMALGMGKFKSVAVRLGREHEQYWEILQGVEEGNSVVTSAQFLLDSESSKTSDFVRLDHGLDNPPSVWVEAQINEIFLQQRRLNLTHAKIDAWQWPIMTMDLPVNSSVPIEKMHEAMTVHLELTQLNNTEVEVSDVHFIKTDTANGAKTNDNSARVRGTIEKIDAAQGIVKIAREAIHKWNRPAASVEFIWDTDSELKQLAVGDHLDFTFWLDQGDFKVISVHSVNGKSTAPSVHDHASQH